MMLRYIDLTEAADANIAGQHVTYDFGNLM
jgi:hypothetical protein